MRSFFVVADARFRLTASSDQLISPFYQLIVKFDSIVLCQLHHLIYLNVNIVLISFLVLSFIMLTIRETTSWSIAIKLRTLIKWFNYLTNAHLSVLKANSELLSCLTLYLYLYIDMYCIHTLGIGTSLNTHRWTFLLNVLISRFLLVCSLIVASLYAPLSSSNIIRHVLLVPNYF